MEDKSYINSLFNLGKLTIFLIILGDVFRKASIFFNFQFIRYTAVFKILLLVIYGLFFLFYNKHYFKNKEIIKLGIIIISLSLIFVASNIFPLNNRMFNFANLEYLIRYLFFPITLLVFWDLFKLPDRTKRIFNLYEVFYIANLFLIVLGFVFEFDVFKSYPNPNRFGYSGVINRTSDISYISVIMILIYYYEWAFLKKENYLKLLLVIPITLLVGTKKIYFSLILLGVFHLYIFRRQIITKRFVLKATFVLIGLIILWETLKKILISKFTIFIDIYKEKGFVSSILTYRNNLLSQTLQDHIIPNWDWYNVFFGGTDFTILRPEMEFFDLFFFFGIFGILLYLFWVKIFLKTIELRSFYLKLTLVLFVIISFFSSGFFISVNIPFLFFIGIYYLNDLVHKNKILKNN